MSAIFSVCWLPSRYCINLIFTTFHVLNKFPHTDHKNCFTTRYIPLAFLHNHNLGGEKASMLTHTYPHKTPWKTKWSKVTICSHQADNLLLSVAWCLIWWSASLLKYGHPRHWMSLQSPSVISQPKPKPYIITTGNRFLSICILSLEDLPVLMIP